MKEQLHEDNFEDFLRNKINQFDDEPNIDMWSRIEGAIPPAPQPWIYKYLTPYSAAVSILVALTVWAVVYQYNSNQALNHKLVEAADKIKVLENEMNQTADKSPNIQNGKIVSENIKSIVIQEKGRDTNGEIIENQSIKKENFNKKNKNILSAQSQKSNLSQQKFYTMCKQLMRENLLKINCTI